MARNKRLSLRLAIGAVVLLWALFEIPATRPLVQYAFRRWWAAAILAALVLAIRFALGRRRRPAETDPVGTA